MQANAISCQTAWKTIKNKWLRKSDLKKNKTKFLVYGGIYDLVHNSLKLCNV